MVIFTKLINLVGVTNLCMYGGVDAALGRINTHKTLGAKMTLEGSHTFVSNGPPREPFCLPRNKELIRFASAGGH